MKIIDLNLYRAKRKQHVLEKNISNIVENGSVINLSKIKMHFREWLLINRSHL